MLSPQPRQPVEALFGLSSFQAAGAAPNFLQAVQGSTTPRPLWYDVSDAEHELREVMGGKLVPDWLPAFERRPLSAASTSADSSTPMNDIRAASYSSPCRVSPPLSPEPRSCETSFALDVTPARLQLQRSPGGGDKAAWCQGRKVFIGGIPQNFDQNDIYKYLSKFGMVKKAWLQLVQGQGQPTQKHRGFGFVIFSEGHSVELLLGEEYSKFIFVGEGIKLEVKRAVSRTDTPPVKEVSEHMTGSTMKQARLDTKPVSAEVSAGQDISRQIVFRDRSNLPQLPPFPPFSGAAKWTGSSGKAPPTSAWPSQSSEPSNTSALPVCIPHPTIAWRCSPQEPSNASAFSSFLSPQEFLLGGLAAQKLCNKDLERKLLDAMPDSYDD